MTDILPRSKGLAIDALASEYVKALGAEADRNAIGVFVRDILAENMKRELQANSAKASTTASDAACKDSAAQGIEEEAPAEKLTGEVDRNTPAQQNRQRLNPQWYVEGSIFDDEPEDLLPY